MFDVGELVKFNNPDVPSLHGQMVEIVSVVDKGYRVRVPGMEKDQLCVFLSIMHYDIPDGAVQVSEDVLERNV